MSIFGQIAGVLEPPALATISKEQKAAFVKAIIQLLSLHMKSNANVSDLTTEVTNCITPWLKDNDFTDLMLKDEQEGGFATYVKQIKLINKPTVYYKDTFLNTCQNLFINLSMRKALHRVGKQPELIKQVKRGACLVQVYPSCHSMCVRVGVLCVCVCIALCPLQCAPCPYEEPFFCANS